MEHTVFHVFCLIPLPLKHRGLWDSLQTECLSQFDKEEIIHHPELLGRHYKNTECYYCFTIPEPPNNSALPLSRIRIAMVHLPPQSFSMIP